MFTVYSLWAHFAQPLWLLYTVYVALLINGVNKHCTPSVRLSLHFFPVSSFWLFFS